jgi:uncharacterized protein (DUF2236 family)
VINPESIRGTTGFLPFADGSMARRVHREGVLLLGGGRALLMQITHPLVARGVAEHSNFRADRIDRLLRTLRPTLAIVFGTKEEALAAAAGINRIHEGVTGAGYTAKDSDLLLWVLATLIDTSVMMHERFVCPLSSVEQAAYYDDMQRVGELLEVPSSSMPNSLDELQAYVTRMCDSLVVTDEAREICEALFASNVLTWPVMGTVRHLTAGLLPEGLRRQFGLPWGGRRQRGLELLCSTSRTVLPRVPAGLRAPPGFLMPTAARRPSPLLPTAGRRRRR